MTSLLAAACVLAAAGLAPPRPAVRRLARATRAGAPHPQGRGLVRQWSPGRPLAGRRRRGRLVRAPSARTAALVLDLLGAAVQAGAAPVGAMALVVDAVASPQVAELGAVARALMLGAPPDRAWAEAPPAWASLRRCLELAAATGAPVAALLREAADQQRRHTQREALAAASRLGVRVVLPLGLCALPGFLLLGVAPVVLGLARTLLGA